MITSILVPSKKADVNYCIKEKNFKTKREKDAYLEALEDLNGWNGYSIINQEDYKTLNNEKDKIK